MFGQPHRHFSQTDSTNRVALDWLDAPHGALVSADAQTHGRGRLGRHWSSPPGKGLYFSLVLRPRAATDLAQLALVAALGVARALETGTSLVFRIKWPNDVLCRGHKIGGLLCESRGDGRVVLGVGLNLTHEAADLPARALFPASSLLLLGGQRCESAAILPPLLQSLETVWARWENGEWPLLRADFEAKMWGIGELVRVGDTLGILRGVDENGALQLQTADGLRSLVAGDLSAL